MQTNVDEQLVTISPTTSTNTKSRVTVCDTTKKHFSLRRFLLTRFRPIFAKHAVLKKTLMKADEVAALCRHVVGERFPSTIRPLTYRLTVAITAQCNLRCVGCRYGRDFMPGHQLSIEMMRSLLDDASALGVDTVRLYGGEPLLHPDLPEMIRYARNVGIKPFLTTNGILLRRRIDDLYSAGLRTLSIGFYGNGEFYDTYVQRKGRFEELEKSLSYLRDKYGNDIDVQLNFLLMKPSCNLKTVNEAWEFAQRYRTDFQVDLIHYSLPYFTEGPERVLQFTTHDRPAIEEVVNELQRFKRSDPAHYKESDVSIRSIPDWLLRRDQMRVPCDAYEMVWVGADGTVQLCYVTFPLGNLHQNRLRELLYTKRHCEAARSAFTLNCPNCHCGRDARIKRHLESRKKYK